MHGLDLIKERIIPVMPDFFDFDRARNIQRKGYSEYCIPTVRQQLVEGLAEALSNRLNVNILYCIRSHDGRRWELVAFSTPSIENMYVIAAYSCSFGLVDEISLISCPSIEIMWSHIKSSMEQLPDKIKNRYEVRQNMAPNQVFQHFVVK